MYQQNRFVILSVDGVHSTYKNSSAIANRMASQIIQENDFDGKLLGITTPYIRRPFKPNEIPSILYPKIIRLDYYGVFRFPKYYLCLMDEQEADEITLFVKVRIKQKYKFSKFGVSLVLNEMKDKTFKDLARIIDKGFKFSHSNSSIQLGSFRPPDDYPALELIKIAQNKCFILKCEINQEFTAIIDRRAELVHNLIKSENEFISDLGALVSYWESCFLNDKAINYDESNFIFGFYQKLIECHLQLLSDLKERGTKFYAEYSDIFCEFSYFFNFSENYSKYYKNIKKLFEIKQENKWFNNLFTKYNNSPSNFSKKSFFDLIKSPIKQY